MSNPGGSLRTLFARIDGAAPSIQQSAAAMMRHYDRATAVAVNEWRSALQAAQPHQLLPLLYVINEVVQTSKRNRGNKFLEALGPVLKQALVHVCQQDPAQLTEKVRRVVKIWGDRRVFSIRYINDLLEGMEPYRPGGKNNRPAPPPPTAARFSPQSTSPQDERAGDANKNDDDDDDIQQILQDHDDDKDDDSNSGGGSMDDDDDDDDENVFGETADSQKLELDINLDSAMQESATAAALPKGKRNRRESTGSTNSTNPKRRRSSVLSPNNLVELWTKLVELEQSMELSQHALASMEQRHAKLPADSLANLVGDELQQAYRQNEQDRRQCTAERQNLYKIAKERKALEEQALRYLVWLEKGLQQDEDDLAFCHALELKLKSFAPVHRVLRKARDARLQEEASRQQREQELARKRKEEEEAERFRKAAFARETEAKPGMVWNPRTQEYQTLQTDESWRD